MATVHGPSVPQHPAAGKSHNIPRNRMGFQPPASSSTASSQPVSKQQPDAFYGHEYIARLCARFITHLFACPEYPPAPLNASSTQPFPSSSRLPYFIAYALHRTKLHSSVNYAALVLLQRLKARFPTARGSSGHRLFISAFMIASKVMCDDTYSNKSWGIVAQGMFSLREVNQMEREMCNYLEWELTVDAKTLRNFETMVKRDFNGPGPYPTYVLSMFTKKLPAPPSSSTTSTVTSSNPPHSTSPIPMFGNTNSSTPPPPSATPHERVPLKQMHMRVPKTSAYTPSPPHSPDTPSSSHSSTTSPTSSGSPPTPISVEDNSVLIAGSGSEHAQGNRTMFTMIKAKEIPPAIKAQATQIPIVHPLKPKMFAFAVPTRW